MGPDDASRIATRVLPSGRPARKASTPRAGRPDLGARICATSRRSVERAGPQSRQRSSGSTAPRASSRGRRGKACSGVMIGFAGMTHLGSSPPSRRRARAFDASASTRTRRSSPALEPGELPVVEPGLDDLLAANRRRTDPFHRRCVRSRRLRRRLCRAGRADRRCRRERPRAGRGAARDRRAAAAPTDAVLVVLSQVPPGFTRARRRSERHLYYQVETLVFGRAVERALAAGALHRRLRRSGRAAAGRLSRRFSRRSAARSCPCATKAPSSPRSRSIAALSRASRSPIRLPSSASASAPTGRRSRRRCGSTAASARTPISRPGSARRRQSRARSRNRAAARRCGRRPMPARSGRSSPTAAIARTGRCAVRRAVGRADEAIRASRSWGLAYKENTHSTKNSPALALPRRARAGRRQRLRSAGARRPAVSILASQQARDPLDACDDADALAIMTPWPQFKTVPPADDRGCHAGALRARSLPAARSGRLRARPASTHHALGAPELP